MQGKKYIYLLKITIPETTLPILLTIKINPLKYASLNIIIFTPDEIKVTANQ